MITRVLTLLSGLMVLGGMILFLLPGKHDRGNLSHIGSQELNGDTVMLSSQSLSENSKEAKPFRSSIEAVSSSIEGFEASGAPEASNDNKVVVKKTLEKKTVTVKTRKLAAKSSVNFDNRCYRLGLFLNKKLLNASLDKLQGHAYKIIEKNVAPSFSTRVLLGPFKSVSLARDADRKASEQGVKDHFYKQDLDGLYIVSLGVYSANTSALDQAEYFRSIGLEATTRIEKALLPQNYWIELPADLSRADAINLSGVSWGDKVGMKRSSCSEM